MVTVRIYRDTNFGNNELVWNVPAPDYDFSAHTRLTFNDVNLRFPLLTTAITLKGDYSNVTTFFDYMIIEDGEQKVYYFIKSIIADRKTLTFSVVLDVVTTYGMLGKAISGVIVRKHDTNPDETRFDYPYALDYEGNYQNEYYAYVGFDSLTPVRLIESAVDLTNVSTSLKISSDDGSEITVPRLPKPSHVTNYTIETWEHNTVSDVSHAFTLYNADTVDVNVLNDVRALSGDGAISDSYVIPSDAVIVGSDGAKITSIKGKFQVVDTAFKLSALEGTAGWVPNNLAIRGMVKVAITSMATKTRITFPGWDLQESVNSTGDLRVNIWCDPKPGGAPYCCPDQVLSLHPGQNNDIIKLETAVIKSVKGAQWLRNPLLYSSGKGEIFATVETQLQREKSAYDKKVALYQLEMAKRERDIEIAQQDYNYSSGQVGGLLGIGGAVLSKDVGGLINSAKGMYDAESNKAFLDQMRDLKGYQQEQEKTLINMAHNNNLKNLNVQESIRRVVASEKVYQPSDSMNEYQQYNGFTVSLIIPDLQSLKAKDMEFSKYGYPTYEAVSHFIMLDHLRENHTVYQFESPLIEVGGMVGDMIRSVLESGIRILSKPYTSSNILNNPKRMV